MRPGEIVNFMFYIQSGVVEIFDFFDGNEFVMERLYQGSIVNFSQFFMQDFNQVYVRCHTYCVLGVIDEHCYSQLLEQNPEFQKSSNIYQNRILTLGNRRLIDCIHYFPTEEDK